MNENEQGSTDYVESDEKGFIPSPDSPDEGKVSNADVDNAEHPDNVDSVETNTDVEEAEDLTDPTQEELDSAEDVSDEPVLDDDSDFTEVAQ